MGVSVQDIVESTSEKAPFISIVIPVYNAKHTLARCLNSILQSQTSDYEIILIDDGSTDGSGELCEQFTNYYPSMIRVVKQKNSGAGAARNYGVKNAHGLYIAFIDADDEIFPRSIDKIIFELENNPVDLLFVDGYNYWPNEKKCTHFSSGTETLIGTGILSREDAISKYSQFKKMPASPCDKIISQKLANHVAFGEGKYYEDLDWCIRLLFAAESCSYRNIQYYKYIKTNTSTTGVIDSKRIDDFIWFFDKWIGFINRGSSQAKAVSRFLSYEFVVFLGLLARHHSIRLVNQEKLETIFQLLSQYGKWIGWKENVVRALCKTISVPHAVQVLSAFYRLRVL